MSRKSTDAIVVHCTATLAGAPYNVDSIRQMHKARGFSDIGYHYLIGLKGEIWEGRKPKNSVGAHVQSFNDSTMGVAYVGGLRASDAKPMDTRTPEQTKSLIKVLTKLSKDYPKAVILGHRDLSKDLDLDGVIEPHEYMKMCPCFDVGPWAKSVGLPGGKLSFGKYIKL
jgi:N-acetyl-anhydromuramyl-L-alanine amidase AmpD